MRLPTSHSRRVKPTASGELLGRYARRILSTRDEALARLKAESAAETGQLVIAASTIPAEYLLPPVLARFRRAHPRVAVKVEVSDSRRALESLLGEACDLALIGSKNSDRRVSYISIGEDEVVLVAACPNPFTRAKRLTKKELAGVPLIVREEGSGTRQVVANLLAQRAAAEPATPTVQVGSTEMAKRCALHGVGLALISLRAVSEELAAGRLELVAAAGLPARRRFFAAHLQKTTLPAAAKALLTLLAREHSNREPTNTR